MQETGWLKQGDDWYWITASGAAATDWTLVNGVWYYMDPASCKMQTTGWFKHKDDWYWITGSGAAATGWVLVNGTTWYYMDPGSCKMKTGWTTVGSRQYYLHPSGAMQPRRLVQGRQRLVLDHGLGRGGDRLGGRLRHDLVLHGPGQLQDEDGVGHGGQPTGTTCIPRAPCSRGGWFKDGNDWYWITASGAAATGWAVVYGTTWYYMDPGSCKMKTGWATVGSRQVLPASLGRHAGRADGSRTATTGTGSRPRVRRRPAGRSPTARPGTTWTRAAAR